MISSRDVVRQRAGDRDDLLRGGAQRAHVRVGRDVRVVEALEQRAAVRCFIASRSSSGPRRSSWPRNTLSVDASGPRRGRAPGRSSRRRADRGARRLADRQRLAVDEDLAARSGSTTPDTHLISVDLPAPLGPSRQWTSPGTTSKSTPFERAHARVLLREPADLEHRLSSLIDPTSAAVAAGTSTQRCSRAEPARRRRSAPRAGRRRTAASRRRRLAARDRA